MDRVLIYPAAIPQDTDLLNTNKNTMVGIGFLLQAILGTGTLVDGLACTPTSPAGMTVNVAGGSINSLQSIDATAYGSIASDTTDQIVKQGIIIPKTNFSCPAPGTSGQSIVYLVEATYQDVDASPVVLPYYNASNPTVPYSGPNNSGATNNTVRKGVCVLALKTGIAATTGTQLTPTPDAGYVGLYAITVANGATTITSGNIAQLASAPFINPKLGAVNSTIQAGSPIYAADTSGSPNTITVPLSPAPASLTAGMKIRVKIANTNSHSGNTVINTNQLGSVQVNTPDGVTLPPNTLSAGGIYEFTFDGTYWQTLLSRHVLTAVATYYINSSTGNDNNNGLTSGTAWLTIQHAINYVANNIDLNGFSVQLQLADGTYTSGALITSPWLGGGYQSVTITGNSATPANVILSTTGGDAIYVAHSSITIQNMKLQTTTGGNCLDADNGGLIVFNNVIFGACAGSHLNAQKGGQIDSAGNYTISGGAGQHLIAQSNGIINMGGLAVTVSGTPAFSGAFAAASQLGSINAPSVTFSGSATGTRYSATLNGVINTSGGGSTYFPGSGAGSTATGGQYA